MDKEISKEKARFYPPRLYAEGESNLEKKSINHNIKLGDLPGIRESIGRDVWEKMKELPIGIVAKLSDSQFTWSGKTVHYLLCRQLRIHKKEIWFIVGGQPIRFGLNEFGHITGLNTDLMPTEPFEPEADYKAFFKELNVPVGEGPTLDELRAGLSVSRLWNPDKHKWLGLLILQAIGIYGLHHNSRIPFESAKRVFDDEAMKTYPWGRSGFETLVDSIKMMSPTGNSYTIRGMVYVLQAWAYESVTCFGERFGKKVDNDDIPLLRWGGKRTHSTMESAIADDIKSYRELRVLNMVKKADVRELFHQWPVQVEDPALDHLIKDIHEKKFVKGFWDVKRNEKRKKVNATTVDVDSESPAKKQKVLEVINSESGESGEGDTQKKKKKAKCGSKEDDVIGDNVSIRTLMDLILKLTSRVEEINSSGEIRNASLANELKQIHLAVAVLQSRQSRHIGEDETNKSFTIQALVNNKTPHGPPMKQLTYHSVTSPMNVAGVDEVKKNLSKDKEFVDNSNDGQDNLTELIERLSQYPTNCKSPATANKKYPRKSAAIKRYTGNTAVPPRMTRNMAKIQLAKEEEAKEAEVQKRAEDNKKRQIGTKADELKVKTVEVQAKTDNVQKKTHEKADLKDITEQFIADTNRMLPESDDDAEEQTRIKEIRALRTESVKLSLEGSALNPPEDHPARVFPYIGDNGLTCMRKNCVHSSGLYDPLAPVDPAKLQKLKEFMAAPDESASNVDLYRVIMTERTYWPNTKYGWLYEYHLCAYLRVLRKRFLRDPCPFHNTRIAFIDTYFASYMSKDYEQFTMNPMMFKFKGTGYEELVNGLLPVDEQTNMKWIQDVDHLYIIPQTGGDHWVALHVDLHKGHIDCYDSIVGEVTEESERKILENCRPFTRMIPAMMNDILPDTLSYPRVKQFTFRRRSASKVPQNKIVGDCGVYALKFVECLALGVVFDGICDDNIQAIRVKMAAEIYDEAPDFSSQFK